MLNIGNLFLEIWPLALTLQSCQLGGGLCWPFKSKQFTALKSCSHNSLLRSIKVQNLWEKSGRNCSQFWFSDFLEATGNVVPVEHRNPRGSHNSKLFVSAVQLRAEGKGWNLYFRAAWKLNTNSAFVPQISTKPICLQKELKRCYKTYIFLNKGWPGLSTPVSNRIWWNCVPAFWDPEVREGDQGSQASPAQHLQGFCSGS